MTVTATTGRILLDVAVILLAARAGGLLFARVGQPAVIGEIAAGVALGPTLLGALPGDPSSDLFPAGALDVLQLIGQLGLVLFMFGVGWDLDLRLVRRREGARRPPSRSGRRCCRSRSGSRSPRTCTRITTRSRASRCRSGRSRSSWARRWRSPRSRSSRASCASPGSRRHRLGALVAHRRGRRRRDRLVRARRGARCARLERRRGTTCASRSRARCSSSSSSSWCGRCCTACCATRHRRARRSCCRGARRRVRDRGDRHPRGVRRLPRRHRDAAPGGRARLDRLGRHLSRAIAVLAPIYFVTSGMAVDIPGLRAGDLAAFVLILVAACAGKFLGAFARRACRRDRPARLRRRSAFS